MCWQRRDVLWKWRVVPVLMERFFEFLCGQPVNMVFVVVGDDFLEVSTWIYFDGRGYVTEVSRCGHMSPSELFFRCVHHTNDVWLEACFLCKKNACDCSVCDLFVPFSGLY